MASSNSYKLKIDAKRPGGLVKCTAVSGRSNKKTYPLAILFEIAVHLDTLRDERVQLHFISFHHRF